MGIDFGVIWVLISLMPLYFTSADPPAGRGSPAVTPKPKRVDRYIVMGIDLGVIWVADFINTTIFYVRRSARRHTNAQKR